MGKVVITEAQDRDADVTAWYVDGRKVYDYHDPYIDELLRAIFDQPEFDGFKFNKIHLEVDEEYQLPEVLDDYGATPA